MEEYKRYFEKKYFLNFLLYFVVWYLCLFVLFSAFQATSQQVFYLAIVLLSPALLFFFSLRYFKHSFNDWEERVIVAFGWVIMATISFALLSEIVYGVNWRAAVTPEVLYSKWPDVIAVILAGFLVHRS